MDPNSLQLSTNPSQQPISNLECPEVVMSNMRSVDFIKSTSSSLAGALAGVLGLTNQSGFFFYLLSSLFVSLLIHILTTTFTRSKSPPVFFKSRWTLWSGALVDNLFSYILWWTLFYGLIHSLVIISPSYNPVVTNVPQFIDKIVVLSLVVYD